MTCDKHRNWEGIRKPIKTKFNPTGCPWCYDIWLIKQAFKSAEERRKRIESDDWSRDPQRMDKEG
jgi:hypothetical protein